MNVSKRSSSRLAIAAFSVAGLMMATGPMASAQTTYFWSGDGTTAGGTGTWNATLTNWSTTGANGTFTLAWPNASNDTAVINGSGTLTVGVPVTVGSLTLSYTSGTRTVSGSTLTINSGISFGNLAGLTWTAPVTLGGNQTWSHGGNNSTAKSIQTGVTNLNGHSLTWNSTNTTSNSGIAHRTITGNGSIIKNGTGWLTLAGTTAGQENTYTGNTTINAGTINAGSSTALGNANNQLTVNGGTLNMSSHNLTVGNLTGTGGVITSTHTSGTRTLTIGSGNNGGGNFQGVIENGITGSTTALTKIGNGTITLSGNNTYTGTTAVNAGTFRTTRDATTGTPFGTGAVTVNAGVLRIAPSGSGSAIAFTGGTATANTNFTYNAGATLELARGTQTSLTYTFGSASAGTAFARGTNGTLVISTSDITNFGTAGSKTERFIINSGSTAPTTVNGIVSGVVIQNRDSSNAGDFAGYDGTDGFTRATYTGTDFSSSSDASVLDIASASTSGATAAFAMRVSGTVTNTGNTITLGSSGNPTAGLILNGGTISGGTLTTPGSSATEFAIYTSGTSEISSSINTATSQAGLSVFGSGTLDLSGSSGNSFTGGLRVNNSTVIATANNQLGSTTSNIALTGGTLQTSGTFALGGGQRAIALAAGQDQTGGTFDVTGGTTTYQNSSTSSKFMSGAGSLTKIGAGTLLLNGNTTNTYTGATNVNAGTLTVGGSAAINTSSAINVAAGASFLYNSSVALALAPSLNGTGTGVGQRAVLGGNATIGAALTLDNVGDVLSPGNSPGILPFGVNQSWASNSYDWELNDWVANTPGTNIDQIAITGNLTLTGATPGSYILNVLSLTAGNATGNVPGFTETNNTWTILTTTTGISGFNDDFWTVNPTGFTSSPTAGGTWNVTQSGNNLILSYIAVPEPTTIALLASGVAILGLGLARRRVS